MPGGVKIRQCLLVLFKFKGTQILLNEPIRADESRTIIAVKFGASTLTSRGANERVNKCLRGEILDHLHVGCSRSHAE